MCIRDSCYGAQFMSYTNGGKVEPAGTREYGRAHLSTFDQENPLLDVYKRQNMTTSNAIRTLSNFATEKLITIDGRKIKIIDGVSHYRFDWA